MRYALIALLGLATLPVTPSLASCPRWAAPTVVNQSNGIDVEFDLTQTGNELSGTAAYHWNGPTQVLGGHMIYSNGGNVEGTLKGSHVELRVRWGDNEESRAIGVYSMDIDEDGRISGETYDFQNPGSRARLLGTVSCTEAAVPPPASDNRRVVHLGKRLPPKEASPVEPLDTNRRGAAVLVSKNGCAQGFVPRGAAADDAVCVTPESRTRVASENSRAPSLWIAGGYGPHTCISGFVWREAFDGDTVCVTPEVRDQVRQENELADSRRAQ
jgi:hypothetical protein